MVDEKSFEIKPLTEELFITNEILISDEKFGFLKNEPLKHDLRSCEIYLRKTAAEYYPNLEITRGDNLVPRKKILFWVGIDDPGQSIFSDIIIDTRENDPRCSWFTGNAGAGYTFHFNDDHPAYKRIKDINVDIDLTMDFFKEEMLKQAYIICILNENYKGLFEELSMVVRVMVKY